jgi:hypothetical protein
MKTLFVCSVCLLLSSTAQADPTRPAPGWQVEPAAVTGAAVAALKLQLIKHTTQGRVAVINGSVVRQGERYKQYYVRQIQDAKVVLELSGEQLVLPLLNTAIKKYEE